MTTNTPLTRITVCDSSKLSIVCPSGYSIQVFKAFYGRTNNNTCGTSWNTNCKFDATQNLKKILIGYQSANVNLTSAFVGENPCPNVLKYGIIDYVCIPMNLVEPKLLPCAKWMKSADLLKANGESNHCICSNNIKVSWENVDQCEPVVTKFYFYEAFITGGVFEPSNNHLSTTTVASMISTVTKTENTHITGSSSISTPRKYSPELIISMHEIMLS